MKKQFAGKIWLICVILGGALVIGAAVLMICSEVSVSHREKDAEAILQAAQTLIPQPMDRVPEERGNNNMAALEIDGVNIIGVLAFPEYGRTLPIAAGWDTGLVASMPCRFTGSIYDRSLIIGATDGDKQLRFAPQMEVGDRLVLTDMEGGRYTYRVAAIQHAKHATLEKLRSGDYALTVFVKDAKTGEYLLIRCQTNP